MLLRSSLFAVALVAPGLALAAAPFLTPSPPPSASQLKLFALSDDNQLFVLREDKVPDARLVATVRGLTGGDRRLVGIDFRPADGRLYGVGDFGGVYRIDTRTASATLLSRVAVPLDGVFFGVDFNPVSDRLRIVSDRGQNLRVDVISGFTAVDDDLTVPGNPTPAQNVTGIAYTNNDAATGTGTVLYAIDTEDDALLLVAPPNQGFLGFIGDLGIDPDGPAGFDIVSQQGDGSANAVRAYASVIRAGRSRLYTVNLVTGVAKGRGSFDLGLTVIDIALPLNQVP